MNQATEPRCLAGCTTAELTKLALHGADDYAALHEIYVELLFRKRRKAIRLREDIVHQLTQLHEYFIWPTTASVPGNGSLGEEDFQFAKGLLGYVGYRVGVDGLSWAKRRSLLDYVNLSSLPRINSRNYMEEWGKPDGAKRLRKLANSIAAFVRNAKRNKLNNYAVAVRHWEADLEYLKKTYFVGRYDHDFPWPKI